MGLGRAQAQGSRAPRKSPARRGRNAIARSGDGSEFRSARHGQARRAAPIAGTARYGGPPKGKSAVAPSSRAMLPMHPPAPAVERIAKAIARLGRRGEGVPAVASGHAGENDRANGGERASPLALVEAQCAARNEAGAPDGLERALNLGAFHPHRPARRQQASFVPLAWRASLVYIRTILRRGFGGRKIQMRR